MSEYSDDEMAVVELSRIAQMYMRRGDLQKAEDVMTLVEDIQRRLKKERDKRNETLTS